MLADYIIILPFSKLHVRANLAEASAPIQIVDDDGSVRSTIYNTADARHWERSMARLAVMSMGRDWWLDPTAPELERDDEGDYVDDLIVSVEAQ